MRSPIKRSHGRRKIERKCCSDNVCIASRIHRNRIASILGASADVGGINQYWINNKRRARVVLSDLKANPPALLNGIAALDFTPRAVNLLVNKWLVLADCAPSDTHQQIARFWFYFHPLRASKLKHNRSRVPSGRNHEVVLQ